MGHTARMIRHAREAYSTGQIAKICKCAPRTVSRWIDAGILKGWRVPLSEDRRVMHPELVRFMAAHSIPTQGLELGIFFRVQLVGLDGLLADRLKDCLTAGGGHDYHFSHVSNVWDAGRVFTEEDPDAVVVDLSIGRGQGIAIAQSVGVESEQDGIRRFVVVLANEDETDADGIAARLPTDSPVFKKPVEPAEVACVVQRFRKFADRSR